jgi:uncharacterized protein with HEPN domain
MSKHEVLTTLRQLKGFAEEASELSKGRSREELSKDLGLRRRAERVVELIGEACNRIPEDVVEAHPEIPWREIVGMRNWLAHGYDSIDYEILWNAISQNASDILPKIERLIEDTVAKERQLERDISDDL